MLLPSTKHLMREMRSSPRRGNGYSKCLSDGLGFRESLITLFVMAPLLFVMAPLSPLDGGRKPGNCRGREQATNLQNNSVHRCWGLAAQTGFAPMAQLPKLPANEWICREGGSGGGRFLLQQTETRRTKRLQFLGP